jgi:HK97 family phage portal protein
MAITWSSWMRYLLGGLWNPETGVQRAGPGSYAAEAGQLVSDSRALQVAAVFRSIRIIAETAASLPLVAYRRVGAGEREPLPPSHWLSRLIEEPNPTQTGDEWREAMFAQMAGWGNGYSRIARQSEGRPVELWVHKADAMEVERRRDRSLVYRYPDADGVLRELNASQVLHLRAFSMDGIMGMSPLALARESLGLTVGAERYAASFFAQGGRPAGVMTSEKLLTDKQREQIRREYGDMSTATDPAGKRFWLLEGSLKYQPITVPPEDMQMLQTRAFQIADIARFFGVPLFLLMETEKSTSWGTGIEQQNLGFLTYTLRPYLSRMVNSFNRWLIPESERALLFVDVDDSPLVAMDSAAQERLLSSFADHGIMTRNEIRARLKLRRATDANADKLTAQSAMLPIDRLGTETRPAGLGATERAAPHVVALGEAIAPITDAITAIAQKQVELSTAIEKLAANAGRLSQHHP